MKTGRIMACALRHLYLYKRSLPRLMEIFYWPLLDLLVWGFISTYLIRYNGELPDFVAFFMGALILWDILFRSQQGISIAFLEDMWSRNLVNIFVSPLTEAEYVASLLVISAMKLVMASSVMILLAWLLYAFNVFTLGFALVPLMMNLIVMGWSVGIVTAAVIMRFGQEAEVLAWGIAFLFQPVSAVFYPVSVLPPVLQAVAAALPSAHVFEGMRAVITDGTVPTAGVLKATGLNVVYLASSLAFFSWNLRTVKDKGLLARVGE
ncbi:MAG TPA: ABC transporter permease [Deltaproteobacteria bacterium]|nr:ABC transporter permease [Deltaproteobacteria bacterium]